MNRPARHLDARALFNVRVPMRDGITLAADVYLPPDSAKAYPVILMFSPYDSTSGRSAAGMTWAGRGFAFVGADCRGRFKSDGDFVPWINMEADSAALLEWISKQSWCNGRVGMVGGSYVAATQLATAASGHPALKAAAPSAMQSEPYGLYYRGGAFVLAFMTGWHIGMTWRGRTLATTPDWASLMRRYPVNRIDAISGIPCPSWKSATEHPLHDAFWKDLSLQPGIAKTEARLFMQGGWFDPICPDILDDFTHASGRYTCLRMGPWAHGVNTLEGEVDYGPQGLVTEDAEIDFLASILRGKKPRTASQPAPLTLFIMGANTWRQEREWPLKRTQWTPFYLGSGGRANTVGGNGWLGRAPVEMDDCPPDRFTYDPENPVPSWGGRGVGFGGQRNQAEIEKRGDVLVYSLPPLTEDMEVTGPVSALLYVSSTAPDTDFTVKLVDVFPDGRPFNVCDGIQRVRYQGGLERQKPLKPKNVYEIGVGVDCTAYVFRRGHRIRVEISSSSFPHYSRHLNTFKDPLKETKPRTAEQTIHHSPAYPSRIILPVIPAG